MSACIEEEEAEEAEEAGKGEEEKGAKMTKTENISFLASRFRLPPSSSSPAARGTRH
jgi:hypothetical protein